MRVYSLPLSPLLSALLLFLSASLFLIHPHLYAFWTGSMGVGGRGNVVVVAGVVAATLAALVPIVVMPLFQQDQYGTCPGLLLSPPLISLV